MFKNVVSIITLATLVYGGVRVLNIPFKSQIISAQSATTLNELSERDRIFNWINKNMRGKTFIYEKSIKPVDSARIEAELEMHLSYSNLTLTERGFSYDETRVIFRKDHQLDNNGKRTGEFQVKDRINTRRIVANQINSSGTIRGTVIPLSNSNSNASNVTAGNTQEFILENNILTVTSRAIGYYEHYAGNGIYKPGASDGKTVYELVDDELRITTNYVNYDVDPQTLSRTPTGESNNLILKELIGYKKSI